MCVELSEYNRVLLALDSIIKESLELQGREEVCPSRDPDKMDDTIKFYKERVIVVRSLRESFENEMARCVP